VCAMVGDAKTQSSLARLFGPYGHDVAFGADFDRVPLMKAGVVDVEVVMVLRECHEVLCPGGDEEVHQLVWLPALGLPGSVQLDGPELRGVSVVGNVERILPGALEIEVAGVPVALLRHRLRPPAGPDAELSRP